MEVFRLSREKYAQNLSASGVEGRWNYDNQYVLYTSQSESLATLELVVHRSKRMLGLAYKLMRIEIPEDQKLYTEISKRALPDHWNSLTGYDFTKVIGGEWYQSEQSLILKVPSAIIPREHNFIINTRHKDFNQVILTTVEDYVWDGRLL